MDRYKFSELFAVYVTFVLFTFWNAKGFSRDNGVVQAVSVEEDLTLTREEKMALEKLKARVLPILPHFYMKQDIYLIRWVRARNLDVEMAEEMLKRNLEWRKDYKMDTILLEDWSDMKADCPYTNDTEDMEGRPIIALNLGVWNVRSLVLSGQMPRLQRYYAMLLEEVTQQVIEKQKQGQNVTQWKMLVNLDGFNGVQQGCAMCLPAYVGFMSTYEDFFPGHADRIIHINTPLIYQIVLNLVRPLFSPLTQEATVYIGEDRDIWMRYLDHEISRDQRRAGYGGTLKNLF